MRPRRGLLQRPARRGVVRDPVAQFGVPAVGPSPRRSEARRTGPPISRRRLAADYDQARTWRLRQRIERLLDRLLKLGLGDQHLSRPRALAKGIRLDKDLIERLSGGGARDHPEPLQARILVLDAAQILVSRDLARAFHLAELGQRLPDAGMRCDGLLLLSHELLPQG